MTETLSIARREHDRSNIGQSVMIISALAAILGLTGFVLYGTTGLMLALFLALILIFMSGRASPALVLKMYKAQPIAGNDLPELQQMFRTLVEKAELPHLPKLYFVPSKMMNAFAVGRGDQLSLIHI